MIIPEREKRGKTFRIPRIFFHAIMLLIVIFIFLLGILMYDYWSIVKQVYENKHLSIENRQLKEQIQLFQMKMNTLTDDINRIQIFENKLRVITGANLTDLDSVIKYDNKDHPSIPYNNGAKEKFKRSSNSKKKNNSLTTKGLKEIRKDPSFIKIKNLYEKKIATNFGLQTGYIYTKKWSKLTKQSFALASKFAMFDYNFNNINKTIQNLEVRIHDLDLFLLDKKSFLKSLPTLIPTRGWLTSFYGPRKSPYSGRVKMHEGIDIGARLGSPIIAPADGIVTYTGNKPGFGIYIQLDHGYGIETIYAHANKSNVTKGKKVQRGDLIALVGNTGYSTGPHVHYEIRVNGTPVDPIFFILD